MLSAAVLCGVANAGAEEAFDLDKLIAAAKQEAPITVYDSTGKIVEQAKAFSEKYGVQATGVKSSAPETLEIVIREAQANNVKADVVILADAPAALSQIVAKGYAKSWLPTDLAKDIPAIYQDPLTIVLAPNVWTYNTALHDSCPVTNIWQLTEADWKGKVAMQDPLGKPSYTDWFNQMATHADKAVADAYQAHYGKPLETDEASATAAWVKALAANNPLLTDSDGAAAEAIGAPDSKDSFVGLVSTAKYRDNKDGMKLGLCAGLSPFAGWTYPSLGLIASGTKSPNSAQLFIRYMMTAEGIAPQAKDGKMSTNTTISLPDNEPSGVGKVRDQLLSYDASTGSSDWEARQDWQDLWALNYKK
jgi:iron(III) transport system substrate-binding protein